MRQIYINKIGQAVEIGTLESKLPKIVDTLNGMDLLIECLWASFDNAPIEGELWNGLALLQAGVRQMSQLIQAELVPDCKATDEWRDNAGKKGAPK